MKYNSHLESFIERRESWKDTLHRIEKSRKTNLEFSLVHELKKIFNDSVSPNKEALKDIIETNMSEVLKIIQNDSIENIDTDEFYVYPIPGHTTDFAQRIILDTNDKFDISLDIINSSLLQ